MASVVKCCVGVLLFFGTVYCLKVVPERVSILYVDKTAIEPSKFYVKRHGRKSDYLLNIEGIILKPWYNNVTMHVIFYEYLHNEYRRSFVELQLKFCDFLNEAYMGGMLKKYGVKCPAYGEYHLMNMTFPTENFPYVVPFEKFRADVFVNTTDLTIYRCQLYGHFSKK